MQSPSITPRSWVTLIRCVAGSALLLWIHEATAAEAAQLLIAVESVRGPIHRPEQKRAGQRPSCVRVCGEHTQDDAHDHCDYHNVIIFAFFWAVGL